MSCNCCDAPPCASPVIQCKSISASKSKCGQLEGGTYYRRYEQTIVNHPASSADCGECPPPGSDPRLGYNGVGSVVASTGFIRTWNDSCTFSQEDKTETVSPSQMDCSLPPPEEGGFPCAYWSSESPTYSFANPYTTAALISATVAALPEWPTGWSGGCSAYRNLSPEESSYSIRRMKWRLTHARTGTCYLKVWLRTRFVPEGGGDPTLSDLPPYTWTATGSPCFAANDEPPDSEANMLTGDEFEEQEPSLDGTTTVEIVKWSCLEGYTPPDDGTANGYPLPE